MPHHARPQATSAGTNLRPARRLGAVLALVTTMAGCSTVQPDAHLAAFSAPLSGMAQVPSVVTPASGQAYAMLDKNTLLLRWKLSFVGLGGPATGAQFHGPAPVGANAAIRLALKTPIRSPLEGRATLTPAQASELLSGKWYVSVHTLNHPRGEIRGQLMLRE